MLRQSKRTIAANHPFAPRPSKQKRVTNVGSDHAAATTTPSQSILCQRCKRETTKLHGCICCDEAIHVFCGFVVKGTEGYGAKCVCLKCAELPRVRQQYQLLHPEQPLTPPPSPSVQSNHLALSIKLSDFDNSEEDEEICIMNKTHPDHTNISQP